MKEIKQKPAGGKPKTADAARVPKAVVKAAWLQAREAARAGEKQVVGGKDGAYSGAADTGEKGADKLVSTGERVTELAYRGGRKLAERSAGQRRERAKAAQTGGEAAQRHGAGETIAHTSTIEASRPPQTREAGRVSDENRPAGARPQQRESRAVGRAKPIKPGREMKQGAPGPKTTEQAGKARQAVQAAARNGQAKARFTQRAQQTAKRAVDTTKRATDAARAGMRALVEALHSLLIALAAGGSVAVLIVVLICLIAFVAGSAYGIFFAAEAPGEDAFTVQQAVEQLGGEYRDYLQQIESTMPHDRQEIKANDDVYYIRWQDVLAVFSSYVSGAEDGAPVAYLDESRLQQLRQTMWDMNEVAYSTYTETVEIEADEPAGDENTDSGDSSKNPGEDTESGNGTESAAAKTVTQTVLLIELTHKTPDEMAQDYCYQRGQKLRACDGQSLYLAERVDAVVLEVVHDIFRRIQQEPYDRSIEQKLRQENGERERQKQAAEKKIKAAQYKQKRYEDEVIRCLDGQSRFSEEMLARLIAEAETEVRQAKEEYAELLRNDTTRATIQQIRSYYDEFLGWANEFDLATIPRKRAILGQLIEKVEVGKGYKVTVHLRMSYAQFLGIEGNGEIQVRKDVCA